MNSDTTSKIYNPKTWHELLEDGKVSAYLIDFKTIDYYVDINDEKVKVSGQRLYVNVPEKEKSIFAGKRLTFFIQYDAYFYFIPKKENMKDILKLLKCRNPIKGKKNDDYIIRYKSEFFINKTRGIKYIDLVKKYVFGLGDDLFRDDTILFRVTLWSQYDSYKYSRVIENNEYVIECREKDVPFNVRCSLDLNLYVGNKYEFIIKNGVVDSYNQIQTPEFPKFDVYTFDIEVLKKPVQPPQDDDPINTLAFKFKDQGYVLNNYELTMQDNIPDFWIGVEDKKLRQFTEEEVKKGGWKYKPIHFKTINCKNENKLLRVFKQMIIQFKPDYLNGYASDFFDWTHVTVRSNLYSIGYNDIFDYDKKHQAYKRNGTIMSDTQNWVRRDSYLPKGKRGLKPASAELLKINALETDHEQQVREWDYIKNVLRNRAYKGFKNPTKLWENTKKVLRQSFIKDWNKYEEIEDMHERCEKLAYDLAFRFIVYNASDVFITDIFAVGTSISFNMTLAMMTPGMNMFEVEKKTRAPMCEGILMRRMNGQMIAPQRMRGNLRNNLNPFNIKREFKNIYIQHKKKLVKGSDDDPEEFWAIALTGKSMAKHCKGCSDKECFHQWTQNWRPSGKQQPFRCHRDSGGKDFTENDVYYTPLKNENFKVIAEKYEGALVRCFNTGVFKWDVNYDFEIDWFSIHRTFDLYKNAVQKVIQKYVNKKIIINKEKGIFSQVRVKNGKEIEELVRKAFEKLISELEEKDGLYYWKGKPILIHVDVASMYPNIIINYNLQPWNIVTEEKCNTCKYRYDPEKGEACCWVNMKWNAVYETIKADSKERDLAEQDIEKYLENHDNIDDKKIKSFYSKHVKGTKKYETYKFPLISRFCQKSHKLFVNTIREFRDGRYKYKYMMIDKETEIEKLEQIIKESSKDLTKKEILEIEQQVNTLTTEKGYARNMQLGLKVFLNSFYGYMKSRGARWWSMDVAGATCMKGQEIITFAIDFCNKIGINIEVDSLDYNERLILLNPNKEIQVISIGEFFDLCNSKYGISSKNIRKKVDYTDVESGWMALSSTDNGKIEWQPITMAIRQKTDRNVFKIKTPFGEIKTTESHSIFHINDNKIIPIEVKNLKKEYIAHTSHIPNIEIYKDVDLIKINSDFKLFVYIPKNDVTSKLYNNFPISNIRTKSSEKKKYYKIPIEKYDKKQIDDIKIGTDKSYKFPSKISLTEELAELCGWYVAKGSSTCRKRNNVYCVDVVIAQNEGKNLDRIEYLVSKIGKYINNFQSKRILSDKKSNTYRIGMSNVFFYHLFASIGCGKTSHVKRIPPIILSAPTNIKKSFLKGYFKGNGSNQNKHKRFYTSSEGLRDDLFVIGSQLGNIVTITKDFSRTSGNPNYIIQYLEKENWKIGRKAHYEVKELNEIYGLQSKSIENVKKSTPYVYDISVKKNNNFVTAYGGVIAHNTDGVWVALPSMIPLEVFIEYEYDNPITKETIVKKDKINLFNEMLNELVSKQFVNENHYTPCDVDGNIRDIFGNIVEDPNESSIELYNYEDDTKWQKDRHWKNVPQCTIKFDADMGFVVIYVYTKKRMKALGMDSKGSWIELEVTGLDELRKGELGLIQRMSKNLTHAVCYGTTIEEVWKNGCDVINKDIELLLNKKLPQELLFEAKDLSETTSSKINRAYRKLKTFFRKYHINPDKFPVNVINFKNMIKKRPEWKDELIGKGSILDMINRSAYSMSGFRTIDMGLKVDKGDAVQWIVTPYPIEITKSGKRRKLKAISQRTVPTQLFNAQPDFIKKYLKRWFGKTFEYTDIAHFFDWDAYLERYYKKVLAYVIKPARGQGIDARKWLKFPKAMMYKKEKNQKYKQCGSLDKFTKLPKKSPMGEHPMKLAKRQMQQNKIVKKKKKKGIDSFLT